ncbi:class I SAM-dependent methyltransferase [Bacillus sp. BGMRC 2118]|nr:class I SAM-dependent methyltransferase [Bacillus sp. BGMRC 2118]
MKKVFAAYYDSLMKPLEKKLITSWRKELLTEAKGEVLEIGAGTGINFPFYRNCTVTALEPNPHMVVKSKKRRSEAKVPITIVGGVGEQLPFQEEQFDTVVITLVLCSVQNQEQTLSEVKRVIKPGGKILFLEHVRMEQPFFSGLQNILNPFWRRVCDGCQLNRNTEQSIVSSGIHITSKKSYLGGFAISVVAQK